MGDTKNSRVTKGKITYIFTDFFKTKDEEERKKKIEELFIQVIIQSEGLDRI